MSELGQLVRNAIEAERAAAEFYRALASDTAVGDARQFLEGMADEEDQHADQIEAYWRALSRGSMPEQTDMEVDFVETAPAWRYATNIGLREAMSIALDAEHGAALYYGAVSDALSGDAKDFFHKLAETERGHATVLTEKLRKL